MKKIYLVLALALILRLISLNQSFWLDEAINTTAARDRGVVDLVTNYSLGDFHPPLYHVFLHHWIKLFGASEISVRTPSIVFGLITIFFTYKISQLIFSNKSLKIQKWRLKTSLVPTLLLSTSGLHIYYSGEARMYSLAAMFITGSFYYLLKLSKSEKNLKLISLPHFKYLLNQSFFGADALLFILFLTGALYTDYVPWLLLPLFAFLLPVLTIISLLTTIPWLPFFARQLQIGLTVASDFPGWGRVVGGFSLKNIILIPIKFTIGRVSIDNNFIYALALLIPLLSISALLLLAIKSLLKKRDTNNTLIFSWLAVPVFIGTLLSLKISLLSYFRFLFILPAFYLVLTLGLTKLKLTLTRTVLVILLATNIVSSAAYLFTPKFHRENWRGFSDWINEQQTTSALTVFPSLAQSAPYLYYQKTVQATDSIEFTTPPETIYLVRYVQEIFDPTDSQRKLIEDLGYNRIEELNFNGVVVWVYQNPSRIFVHRT